MNNNDKFDISNAIIAGLEVLNDREIKVRADLMDDLVVLKNILGNIKSGNLVIASPDRILSKDAEQPENINDEINQEEN